MMTLPDDGRFYLLNLHTQVAPGARALHVDAYSMLAGGGTCRRPTMKAVEGFLERPALIFVTDAAGTSTSIGRTHP